MATETPLPFVDRLLQLLQHLGIERAHVAGAVPGDWRGLATAHADRLASLSVVCPAGFDPAAVSGVASRVQVIHGDERVRAAVGRVAEITLVTLAGYPGLLWADMAVERGEEIAPAVLDFVRRMEQKHPSAAPHLRQARLPEAPTPRYPGAQLLPQRRASRPADRRPAP